jgi:hypothetical protein
MKPTRLFIFLMIILPALLFMLVNPIVKGSETLAAPLAPGHNIYFQAAGLPDGISFTITGLRVNNGGNPNTYSTSFTTPSLSAAINADPDSEFTYSGFPASVTLGGQTYQWINTLPASPFVVGPSGGSTTVTATYAVTCTAPAIQADPISQTAVYGDPVSFTLSASGTSPLSYEWYKDGSQISGADQSTYSIPSASMSDAGLYHAVAGNACGTTSSSQAQLTVNKADQAISFTPPDSPAAYGATFDLEASASSGLAVSFGVSGVCNLAGTTVSMTSGTGTCTVTASQSGNANYNPAADVQHTVEAMKADQAISFTPPDSPAAYGATFDLEASASSGLAVSFGVSGVCGLAGTTVSMTSGTGTCTVTASQSGNANYNPAADAARIVQATRASQAITFEQPVSPVKYQTSFTVAPGSSSNLPVTLASSGSCTSSGYTVTITKTSGACVLTATQTGNINYQPAEEVQRSVAPAPNGNVIFVPLLFSP